MCDRPEDSKLAISLADPFMFQDYYGDRAPEALAKEFGPQFVVALEKLKPGSWQGPIESGYGWHLVYVDTVIPGRIPAFERRWLCSDWCSRFLSWPHWLRHSLSACAHSGHASQCVSLEAGSLPAACDAGLGMRKG